MIEPKADPQQRPDLVWGLGGTCRGLGLMRPRVSIEQLLGRLAFKISKWRWAKSYKRWRSGKRVSVFERRWLAISSLSLGAVLAGQEVDWERIVSKAKPWPRRNKR